MFVVMLGIMVYSSCQLLSDVPSQYMLTTATSIVSSNRVMNIWIELVFSVHMVSKLTLTVGDIATTFTSMIATMFECHHINHQINILLLD